MTAYYDTFTDQYVEIDPPEADGRRLVHFPEFKIAGTGYFDPHGPVFATRFIPVPDSEADAAGAALMDALTNDEAYLAWENSKVTEYEDWLATQGGDGSDTRWRDPFEASACRWCGMSMESHE